MVLYERASTTLEWMLEDGKLSAGTQEPGGINGVSAKCLGCGHSWTLRGVLQVSDLPAYDDFEDQR